MGLRAKLVEDSSIATAKRLYEMRQKMSPELTSFIKGLPDDIQPTSLESMYDAIRRWADKVRAGQPNHDGHEGGRRRRERHNELKVIQPSASTGTTSTSTTSTQGGATHEATLNMMTGGIAQALAKVGAKGKGKGDSGGKGAPVTLQKCSKCKGMHIPKLALESCQNKVSLEAGTLKDTLSEGKKCTYWVQREPDGSKKKCGGEGHTWEDHRAAVVKAQGGVGNTGEGKGGKGKEGQGQGHQGGDRRAQGGGLRHFAGCQAVLRVCRDVGGDGLCRHHRAHRC